MRKVLTDGMLKKINDLLCEFEYLSADEIADRCGMKAPSVYRAIRLMRLKNIGILTTNKGYILAEYAKKTDDVNFVRRLYGRKVSDYIAAKAAEPHITKRWKGIEQKKQLRLMMQPLTVNIANSGGMKVLLSKIEPKQQKNLIITKR